MSKRELSNAREQWRDGVPLNDAWFHFADPRSAELFRNACSQSAQRSRQIMMVVDLWAKLNSGELQAFGDCVAPTISDGPVLIPIDVFHDRPPLGIENSDVIEMSGWRYQRVKVASVDQQQGVVSPSYKSPAGKRGPKPIGSLIASAIEHLRATDPLFDGRSQEKQINEIRVEVARQNPARFPKGSQPSHTTVWNYLTGRRSMS